MSNNDLNIHGMNPINGMDSHLKDVGAPHIDSPPQDIGVPSTEETVATAANNINNITSSTPEALEDAIKNFPYESKKNQDPKIIESRNSSQLVHLGSLINQHFLKKI